VGSGATTAAGGFFGRGFLGVVIDVDDNVGMPGAKCNFTLT
jgi:hypothetical protein